MQSRIVIGRKWNGSCYDKPFQWDRRYCLIFKQHEMNQKFGSSEIIWLSLRSEKKMLVGGNFLYPPTVSRIVTNHSHWFDFICCNLSNL